MTISRAMRTGLVAGLVTAAIEAFVGLEWLLLSNSTTSALIRSVWFALHDSVNALSRGIS